MPDVIIRPARASDDVRNECEDLASAMRDRGFEAAIELPGEEEVVGLGSVDLVVQITDRASEQALDDLVDYFSRHGWKQVRQEHQGARSSKGSAQRIVAIAVGDTRTVMERSER